MKKTETPGKTKKENRLEKVVVFLLVVLISLLSFSVGVISGKGLSDKEYALKTMDSKYSHALNTEGEEASETDEESLSEEEIQQLANAAIQAAETSDGPATQDTRSVAQSSNAPQAGASHAAGAHDDHGTSPKAGAASAVAAKPAAVAKTQATPFGNVAVKSADERVPSSVNRVSPAMEYTVQVASYPTPNDAESMAASYVKKGFPAFPVKVSIEGRDWYRVSIGSFKSKKEAMVYQNDLKKQGVVKDSVVQKLKK